MVVELKETFEKRTLPYVIGQADPAVVLIASSFSTAWMPAKGLLPTSCSSATCTLSTSCVRQQSGPARPGKPGSGPSEPGAFLVVITWESEERFPFFL